MEHMKRYLFVSTEKIFSQKFRVIQLCHQINLFVEYSRTWHHHEISFHYVLRWILVAYFSSLLFPASWNFYVLVFIFHRYLAVKYFFFHFTFLLSLQNNPNNPYQMAEQFRTYFKEFITPSPAQLCSGSHWKDSKKQKISQLRYCEIRLIDVQRCPVDAYSAIFLSHF